MKLIVSVAACLLAAGSSLAHDMFLLAPDHDFSGETPVTVWLYNGTFDKSENAIDRDRMIDVTVVDGEGGVTHPTPDQWQDEEKVSILTFDAGAPGTHVVGVSTKPNMIELTAEEFNDYLQHDGVLDVLEARRKSGSIDSSANERYSKHVKMILQVGDGVTQSWDHRLGYPLEIVPLTDPSDLCPGDALKFDVLGNGEPVAGQLLYASFDGHHAHGEDGDHREAIATRTDEKGQGQIEISEPGRWYIRMIRMVESADEGVDYESNWATLTFEAKCKGGN